MDQLSTTQDQHIVLEVNTEGPSLRALGIVDRVISLCDPARVSIRGWCNAVENVPFQRLDRWQYSHFFWMSRRYWTEGVLPSSHQYAFGYFMGRRTLPRAVMMYDVLHEFARDSMVSAMRTRVPDPWVESSPGIDVEHMSEWVHPDVEHTWRAWWRRASVPSLDGATVSEQYQEDRNTNQSLLRFYNRFDIELVAETYTRGDTFFVTEKTVRPIVAGRPMLIYGPCNFLARLHELGFRTWHSLWDESYDALEGPARWEKIRHVMRGIVTMPTAQRAEMLIQAQHIVEHNRSILDDIIKRFQPQ